MCNVCRSQTNRNMLVKKTALHMRKKAVSAQKTSFTRFNS